MASGLFSQLISMGMTASWVILVVLAVRLLFQRLRLPKKYSYYLWAVPALRLICPVSVSSAFSLFNVDFIGRRLRELQRRWNGLPREEVLRELQREPVPAWLPGRREWHRGQELRQTH
ncbi:MAG: M56 family metallopeptidase [Eisenbergiella massiliensis]